MSCIRSAPNEHASCDHVTLVDGVVSNGSAVTPSNTPTQTTAAEPAAPLLRPAISHIDFWPSCQIRALRSCDAVFEHFDVLVERANRWMRQFTDFELISVETADKKVRLVQDIYSASMIYQDEENTTPMATHIKGLRLWYRQRRGGPSTPDTIHFVDVVPQYLNPGEKHPKFETLSTVLERLNTRLRHTPLQGRIINIETVTIKIPETVWSDGMRINSKSCQCYDEYHTHQVAFLRIFYQIGPPGYELVGIQDFPPDPLDEGGTFRPARYTPFTTLIDKARGWIHDTQGIRVTNIQTLDTKHRKKSENQGQRFNTERMFEYKIEERFRAYFVRVGYVRAACPDRASLHLNPALTPDLTVRSFVPLTSTSGYENITELLERADVCLNVIPANAIHVEAVSIPEWMTRREFYEKGDRTFYDGEWYFKSDKDGNTRGPYRQPLLCIIRVYFDAQFEDPPFMRSNSIQPAAGSCCFIM